MFMNKHGKLAEGGEDDSVISREETPLSTPGSSEDEDAPPGQEGSQDTEDEIAGGKRTRSKKTLKRKRRATEPSHFGETLQSLLNTDAPSGLPLSLKPSVGHQKEDARLELEARKVVRVERKEREERGRVRDVIGGWGGESERSLRKVAQRGVVKLFNTIQQSQLATAAVEEKARASRGTGKPSLPMPSLSKKDKEKRNRNRLSVTGGRKQGTTDKDNFFDMIRSGGIVSKE